MQYTLTILCFSAVIVYSITCRLCQDMREVEFSSSAPYANSSVGGGHSSSSSGPSYLKHLDEHGKRKTIKQDSYFSDEDASD